MAKTNVSQKPSKRPKSTFLKDLGKVINPIARDLRKAQTLGQREARFLVDTYYSMQQNRIREYNRMDGMEKDNEPNEIIGFVADMFCLLEKDILYKTLDHYSQSSELGQWARSIKGIGPVLAAALLAYIDITKVETAGAIWRFGGIDPTLEWFGEKQANALIAQVIGDKKDILPEDVYLIGEKIRRKPESLEKVKRFIETASSKKGDKAPSKPWSMEMLKKVLVTRPYNAKLKVILYKVGEQFVKLSSNEGSFYGGHYAKWKAKLVNKNESGGFKERADQKLAEKKIGKTTDAYKCLKKGMLAPDHINKMAKRKAIQLFIAHYFEQGRKFAGLPVPKPYPIAHLDHNDYIAPPESEE